MQTQINNVSYEGLFDLSTYTNSVTVNDSRLKDIQGGYKVVGNIVYVNIVAKLNKKLSACPGTAAYTIIKGMPVPKNSMPLNVTVQDTSSTIAKGAFNSAIGPNGQLCFYNTQDVESDYILTIIGQYIKQ